MYKPFTGRRRRAVDDTFVFNVGTENCGTAADSYCNGPLKENTEYR